MTDTERNELLLTAVAFRSDDSLRLLLKGGASPRAQDCTGRFRCSPLVFAAERGNVTAARILLAAGAGPDAGPALRAVFQGAMSGAEQLALVRTLLGAGVPKDDRAEALRQFRGKYGIDGSRDAREHDRYEGGTFYSDMDRLLAP